MQEEYLDDYIKPLTILQVIPRLVIGGVERGVVDISLALERKDLRSLVASGGGPLVLRLQRGGIEHFTLPLDSKNPITILLNALRLAKLIKREEIDIIHARSRAPAWSAFLAHKMTGCKFLTTFHGNYSLKPMKPLKKLYNSIMIRGQKTIAVSKFINDQITKHYVADPDKITMIHRGVDLEQFSPDRVLPYRLLALRNKITLPDGKLVITIPGRLTPWKGHKVLINALALLDKDDFCCLVVGDVLKNYDYYLELFELADKLGLKNNVIFAGKSSDMPATYLLSDIIVAPSETEEPFGRIAIEAQAMGRIIVATDLGGFKETITDGETGFLVPPNDSKALAETITRISKLTEHKKKKIMKASMNNAALFSLEKMRKKTLAIYRELVKDVSHL